jgi:hypothetical protein
MKRSRAIVLGVVVAAGSIGMSQGVTLAQAADDDAAKQQQAEQRRQAQAAKQAERAARKAEKAEREQLANMPKPAREAITAQVGQGTNVDYYKVVDGDQREFGAKFTDASGAAIDVMVDRDGKVLSRTSSADAATAAAKQPATPAPAPAPAAPGAPAPATPAAAAQFPVGQSVTIEQIPHEPQTTLRNLVKDVRAARFQRSMFGTSAVWEAKFNAGDGKDMVYHVDDAGRVVQSRQLDADDKSRAEVKFDSMPGNVKDEFRKVTKGHDGAQFYTNTWEGKPVYETMYWEKDDRWVVRLDASGKEVDRRVLKDAKRVSDYGEKDRKDKDDGKSKDKK